MTGSLDAASLSYRPHLDGIRAVAVLLVFVFHANATFMRGGFIGVDVFFVLSGYLITRVMLGRRDAVGRFDLPEFYARRARRLLPAMIALVSAVIVHEALWGSIVEAGTRLREIVSTLLYVANWNLILQADDYFAEAVSVSPLRHAWSLAVEEQFYLLFPLLLLGALAVGRRRRWLTPASLTVLAVASAGAMAALIGPTTITRVYYGTDTRAHQLLIGALLGYLFHRRHELLARFRTRAAAGAGAVALIALIALSLTVTGTGSFYFTGGSVVVALVTAALIVSVELVPSSPTGRLLSTRPAIALGKISYGVYLWHWPIVLWLAAPEGASFLERRLVNVGQFALTVAAATLSYVFVEAPIRERKAIFGRISPRRTVAIGLATSLVLAVVAIGVLRPPSTPALVSASPTEAFSSVGPELVPQAAPPETSAAVGLSNEQIAAQALGDKSVRACPENPRPCVKVEGATGAAPTVVLIGDSTAQAYGPGLEQLAAQHGFRYVQAAVGGCPISHRLLATGSEGELHKASNHLCWEELPAIYSTVLDTWAPRLIIATSWNETNQHVVDGELIEADTPEHYAAVEAALRQAIDTLTSGGADLVFIDVLPPGPGVTCLDVSEPNEGTCSRPVPPDSRERAYNAIFHALADELPQVYSISVTDVLCPDDVCGLMLDGTVVRYDGGHFTGTAARRLAPVLAERLAELGIDLAAL